MVGMQRFVTYIYAYDDGQKGSNAGYAKIETRGSAGKMEIHFSGAEVVTGTAEVFFLKNMENGFAYFPAGFFSVEDGAGVFRTVFQTSDVMNSGQEFERFAGIGIRDSHGRGYLSFWKDVKQTVFTEELFVQGGDEIENPDARDEDFLAKKDTDREMTEPIETQIEVAEQEALHTMEIPVRNIFPKTDLASVWENIQKSRLSVQINKNVNAVQIELKDIRELPRQYWYLGNNSFLLHGFFNYRYLLLGKLPNEKWFLGVPGVYQKQERVMAAIFGFPGFLAAGEMGEESYGEQQEASQNLRVAEEGIRELQPGAWYHILEG